ncbi:MAG: acyl-CoA dehydrogenase family protein [Methylobacterium mesophilicum]|nr:acyl-CoA dehydrogenase family protein [Methylobacterium mesophilicum]
MTSLPPRTHLDTHEVLNQPAPLEDVNLYEGDALLRRAVRATGGANHETALSALGAQAGSAEAIALGVEADRNPPETRIFDRFGQRLDEVSFHPAYHHLMRMGLEAGVSARAWTHPEGGHVAHAALLFLMSQAESGVTCPMSMTYAAVPTLRRADPVLGRPWLERIMAGTYDPAIAPVEAKGGVTLGMALTEKQGGSDVWANTTRAARQNDGSYELIGHKWFCSAPMSDGFLSLAQTEAGLACFLVPRWLANGTRNRIEIQRLKNKLGDRAHASSEIEYHGAQGFLIGAEGRGVSEIVAMINHTRLDCAVAAASLMRQSLSLAIHHAEGRSVFGQRLIAQPLMRAVLADLALEAEAAVALAFRTAQSIDRATAGDRREATLSRLLTPVAKYWNTKRCPALVAEAVEAHGGAGYVEESLLPRLFRASPLNAIWEGSGNVMALDTLRALEREPGLEDVLRDALRDLSMLGPVGREGLARLDAGLASASDQRRARRLAQTLAVLLAAATLQRWNREASAQAFLATRLDGHGLFGAAAEEVPDRLVEEARIAI